MTNRHGTLDAPADDRISPAMLLHELGFRATMACEIMRFRPDFGANDAMKRATDVLSSFLKDEGIRFGSPGYRWEHADAITLIRECDLDYWERTQ